MGNERFSVERGPRTRIPGTVSEKTLIAFIGNANLMGWTSIDDPRLRELLSDRSINQLPNFDREVTHELSRAIMFLNNHKNAPPPARKIPNLEFTVYSYERNNIAIRIGKSQNPDLAPIPNEISGLVIATFIEHPDFRFTLNDLGQIMQRFGGNPIRSVREQIGNIHHNLNILNILFGFGKTMRRNNGYYFLTPQT